MKKLALITLLIFGIYASAQTPYDSFAPETSRPMLELREPEPSPDTLFCAIVADMSNQTLLLVDVSSREIIATAPITDDISKWLSVDPLSDKYPNISPYAYAAWNPIKYVDPTGEWIAVINIDDTGTSYKVVGGTIDVDDCNVYVVGDDYDMKRDGKPQDVEVLGQTATPYSFCNDEGIVMKDAIIDMSDKSGDAFLARFQNNEIPLLGYIMPKTISDVSGRNGGGCDFKCSGDANRGMPLSIFGGKIGTARDVGNVAAGYLTARKYMPYGATMWIFDKYHNYKNNTTAGEPPVSRWAQMLGFGYGMDALRANKFNRTNIYKAYR